MNNTLFESKNNFFDSSNQLLCLTIDYLKTEISLSTGIAIRDLREKDLFEKYGMDSVVVMEITKRLEEKIGHLSKTLFFEFDTIEELASYLVKEKAKELSSMFDVSAVKPADTNINHKIDFIEKNKISKKINDKEIAKAKLQKKNIPFENEDIAIIGISGKYPMADDLKEFWENLKSGKDCIEEIPKNRWDNSLYFSEDKNEFGKTYSKWGGFLSDIDKFDPLFFNMTPLEANYVDPQERLFLEETYHAIEDAGYSKAALDNTKTGVFVGVMFGLYQLIENNEYGSTITGRSNFASIANRVSYFFNLHGPSIALDTMCSSSLTALYLACNSIYNKEIEMAIVGGVNLMVHPNKYIQLSQGGFLSTDGRCRSFGEGGDGYVPGEGVGSMIIKPLKKAVKDGDHIYAVIKGIGINSGGKTSGYTVPNPKAQSDLIKDVLVKSKIEPETISYVEAHGTGTALGDPIEINAITNAYSQFCKKKQFCSIGSVKSNIGHTESAAGMAAITKVILQMKNKQLVPSIHSEIINKYIEFEDTPFKLQRSLSEWEQPFNEKDGSSFPRRAAISAFGAGGSNAHLILEEYCENINTENTEKTRLFVFSAKNKKKLIECATQIHDYLKNTLYSNNSEALDSKPQLDNILKDIKSIIVSISGIAFKNLYDDIPLNDLGFKEYEFEIFSKELSDKFKITFDDEIFSLYSTIQRLSEYVFNKFNTDYLNNKKEKSVISLDDLEYTLQVGRDAMDERLAITSNNIGDLISSLEKYIEGETENESISSGNINDFSDKLEKIVGSDIKPEKILEGNDLNRIKELWVIGVNFEFSLNYVGSEKKRISLPVYPFEKLHCWVTSDDILFKPNVAKNNIQDSKIIRSNKKNINTSFSNNEKDITEADIKHFAIDYIFDIFSEILKIPKDSLNLNSDFETYGLDSIYVKSINQFFETVFGKLPSTLLFTYKTIKTLADYFVLNHKKVLVSLMKGVPLDQNEIINSSEVLHNTESSAINLTTSENNRVEDIAIIGLSGKMPESENLEDFFNNLRIGKDFIKTIPSERWNYENYPEIKGHYGSFLEDVDKFDPQFFNISPMTAQFMDPQERLMLQCVWSCIEDAGYTPKSMENTEDEFDTRGEVSVFVGATFNEYGHYGAQDHVRGINLPINSQMYSIANRISYLFNLGGPSLTVDTACSSSLYALHMACESIRSGECKMAIAGGVNLSLHPSKYVTLSWGKFLADDGHCRTFGDGGTGYVPGEGCAAVLLKPLKQAEIDGDNIYGVIKGSAVNHGGKTFGYSVPNPTAQTAVINKAIKNSHIDPRTITYIEAHGTGTALGDPIEVNALTDAFRKYTDDKQFCSIGSVKSNIGHLEAAAGISQLVKVLLQMKHKTLVPSRINSDKVNSNLDFENTPFYIQIKESEWKKPVINDVEYNRRAGISAFGVGGVNVHVIVEEYEKECIDSHNDKPVLIPLSAKNENSLSEYVQKYIKWIENTNEIDLPDIKDASFTLINGRVQLSHRVCFVAENFNDLKNKMKDYLENKQIDGVYTGTVYDSDKSNSSECDLLDANDIGKMWVAGKYSFSDNSLKLTGKRVSLPTYPFAKEIYWMYSREKDFEAGIIQSKENGNEQSNENENFLLKLSGVYESERLDVIISEVRKIFAELLGFTEGRLPDINEGFFALGLESIATREACSVIEERLGIEIDQQFFFNYPNIKKASEQLLSMIDFDKINNPERSDEKECSIVLSKNVYLPKKIEKVDSDHNVSTIFICNNKYKKYISSKLSNNGKVLFADNYDEGIKIINNGTEINRILIIDISLSKNEAISLIELIKAFQKNNKGKKFIDYYYIYDKKEYISAEYGAVRGLLSTLRFEDSDFSCKEIAIDVGISTDEAKNIVLSEYCSDEYECNLYYNSDGRFVQQQEKIENISSENGFCKDGVYIITGGLGGVGIIITEYLCFAYNAKVVLCGRRSEAEVKDKLESINASSDQLTYIQTNITIQSDVDHLVSETKLKYGHINGIIHAAGVIKDEFIAQKTGKTFMKVIEPKINGTLCLDTALKNEKIDLFILCSSLSAVHGNAGQSDYCYANNFINEFAKIRNNKVSDGDRFGHTVAIDWSFWKNGGMKIDKLSQKWMKENLGLYLMDDQIGIKVLEKAVNSGFDVVNVMYGDEMIIDKAFGLENVDKTDNNWDSEIENMDFDEVVSMLENEIIDQ